MALKGTFRIGGCGGEDCIGWETNRKRGRSRNEKVKVRVNARGNTWAVPQGVK
jgi:hypothetical protein